MSKDSSKNALAGRPAADQKFFQRAIYGRFKPKADFGGPGRVIATAILIFLISQLLAGVFVSLIVGISQPGKDIMSLLDESASVQFFYVLLAEATAVAVVLLVLRARKLSRQAIGLIRPRFSDIWKGLVGFAVFYGLLIVVISLLLQIFPGIDTGQEQDIGFKNLNTANDTMLAFVALVLLPPIGEEILMRGYLYSGLRSRWRFVTAGLVTSAIFGAAHLQLGTDSTLWLAAVNTFVLSLVLVYLRERTGALYAGMLVHALNNFIAFGVRFHLG